MHVATNVPQMSDEGACCSLNDTEFAPRANNSGQYIPNRIFIK